MRPNIYTLTTEKFANLLKQTSKFYLLTAAMLGISLGANAAVTVTAATGGTNISADRAANAASPQYTTLGDIVIDENNNGDFSNIGNNRTIVLTAPLGWQFQAGTGTVSIRTGRNLSDPSVTITATTITVEVDVDGNNEDDRITIAGIRVRATEGANITSAGNIVRTGGTMTISGVTNNSTNFGSLSQAVGAANNLVVVLPGQTFTDANTLAASGVTGTVTGQAAGTAFTITKLIATDQFYNIVTSFSGAKTISYSGPGNAATSPTYTTAVNFTSGQSTTTLTTNLKKAETVGILASNGSVSGPTSSQIVVSPGALNNYLVEAAAGGNIGAQAVNTAFSIKTTARDAQNNTVTSFTGKVNFTSTGTLSAGGGASASFVAGVLNTHSVTYSNTGTFTITATNQAGAQNGVSNSFVVAAAPTISSLSHTTKTPCDATFTLTVNGTNFVSGSSVVRFNGNNKTTTFVSTTQLTATIPASDLATPGPYNITVINTTPSGVVSNAIVFTVSAPTAVSVSIAAVPSGAVCPGTSIAFTATPTNGGATPSYQWKVNGSNVGTNSPGYSTTALTNGQAVTCVMTSNLSGCLSNNPATSNTFTANISTPPSASIGAAETSGTANNDGTICSNGTVTLTASPTTGMTYSWASPISATGNGKAVSPATNTTYTVTVTQTSTGCSATASRTITVNALPTPTINVAETSGTANNDGTICSNGTVTLTASPTTGMTYNWASPISATGNGKAVSPATNTTYTVTVTQTSTACSATASRLITVNALPSPTIGAAETSGTANNDGTICSNGTVTLTASPTTGMTYNWASPISATGNGKAVSPTSNTTYTVTVTNSSTNCSATVSRLITVNSLPAAAIGVAETSGTANNDGTICSNGTVTLTASPTSGMSYNWASPISATGNGKAVSPTSNTTYTVTVTGTLTGCSASATRTITVNQAPAATLSTNETSGTANNDGTICSNGTVTLVAGPGSMSYAWASPPGGTGNNKSVSPTSNTTYRVTVTNSTTNCSATATALVTVYQAPSVSIAATETSGTANNDGTICNNGTVTLTASPASGMNYSWASPISATGNGKAVSPTSNTTYTVTVTNSSTNCSATVSRLITVSSLPAAAIGVAETSGTANNDGTICSNGTVTLTASPTTGMTYSWASPISATGNGKAVSPTSNTTYTVTVTQTSTACSATASRQITVNAVPSPTIGVAETSGTANNDGTICSNGTVTLTASPTTGMTYNWASPISATGNGKAVSPTSNTTYTVTVTQTSTACSATASRQITVNALPSPTIGAAETSGTANNDGTICSNGTVTLTANPTTGMTYSWASPISATGNGKAVSPTSNTTYTVTVTQTSTACSATASRLITVNPLPTNIAPGGATTICQGLSTNITIANSQSGVTYQLRNHATNANVGVAVAGNNGTISLSTGALSSTTTFNVLATRTSTNCSVQMGSTVTITVSVPYTVEAAGADLTCQSASPSAITLSGATVGNGATQGQWSLVTGGGTLSSTSLTANPQNVTYTPAANFSGTATIRLTTNAPGACPAVNDIRTINVNPSAVATPGPTINVCRSASPAAVTLSGASVSGGASTGAWSIISGGGSLSGTSQTANPQTITYRPAANFSGTVTLRLTTNATGACPSTFADRTVNVNALPTVTVSANYCAGNGNVQLSSPLLSSYAWSTGGTTQSVLVDQAGTYTLTATNASGCSATASYDVAFELVTNGSFSGGNTGFITGYTNNQTANGLFTEGNYAVNSNANFNHSNFFGTDHTNPGTGNFLIVNGNTTSGAIVWQQTVTVIPNTTYYFSAWALSMNTSGNYAQLQFNVNGAQIGSPVSLSPGATGTSGPFNWNRIYTTWNSGALTTAVISIVDLQTAPTGNDFGLDDISCSTLSTVSMTVAPSGNGPVCNGNSINLLSNVTGGSYPLTYAWSGPSSYTSSSQNPSIAGASATKAGSYGLTVTDTHGCTAVGSTSVAVSNLATVNAGSDNTVCQSASPAAITLSGASVGGGSTTAAWSITSGGGSLSSTSQTSNPQNITYTPAANFSGTAILTLSASSPGCATITDTRSIIVNPLPAATISATETSGTANNDGIICSNGTVTLTANPTTGMNYSWASPISATGNGKAVSPTSNTTYTVTVTNATTGCSAIVSRSITVNAVPASTISATETSGTANNDGTICAGAPVTLNASPTSGMTFAWASPIGSTGNGKSVSPSSTATYTVTVTQTSTACSATASRTINVNALPTPTITFTETSGAANNDGITCTGAPVTLIANPTSGMTYAWASPVGGTGNNKPVSPASTTSYTVTVTQTSTACAAPVSSSVTVNPLPGPTISVAETSGTANNDGIICSNGTVTLTANPTTGMNYSWASPISATGNGKAVSPATTTSYTVTVTNATTACSATVSRSITVNAVPAATIGATETSGTASNDGTICNGASVTLNASPTTGTTFAWASPIGGTGNGKSVSPSSTATYTVTVTQTTTACSATASRTINVNALPTPTITFTETSGAANNDGITCTGAPVTLIANPTSGMTYAWASPVGGTGNNKPVSPASTTSYTVTVTQTSTACAAPVSSSVTVNALPAATISYADTSGLTQNDGVICNGSPVVITANAAGGLSYSWSGPGGTANFITVSPSSTTNYSVSVTNPANGCVRAVSAPVTVSQVPAANISVSGGPVFCRGEQMNLHSPGANVGSYNWSGPNGFTASSKNVVTSASITGNYYLIVRQSSTGCYGNDSLLITVNSLPDVTASNDGPYVIGQNIQLQSGPNGLASYSWSKTGGYTSNVQNPSIAAAVIANAGLYTVTATDANGCSNTASTSVVVNTGIIVWQGHTADWHTAANWTPAIVPNSCSAKVLIPSSPVGGNPPTVFTAVSVGDIEVQDDIRVTLNANLNVCGTWTGGGVFPSAIIGVQSVVFTGSTQQTLEGRTQFTKLHINNPSGAKMQPASRFDIIEALELGHGNFDATDGRLRFLSPSSAQVGIINDFGAGFDGTLTGSIAAQRGYDAPVTANSFSQHLMGSPVNAPAAAQFGAGGTPGFIKALPNCYVDQQAANSPFGTFFEYDEANGANCGMESWKSVVTGNTQNGKGYSVAKPGAGTLTLQGEANLNATYTVGGLGNSNWSNQATYLRTAPFNTVTINSGWHLVSNPYLAYLDLQAHAANGEFGAQAQVWETTGPFAGSYQPRMAGSGGALVAPFQGFMVRKLSTATPAASYTLFGTDRTTRDTAFYRQADDHALRIFAEDPGTGKLDVTAVAFNTAASVRFDAGYDANKLMGDGGRQTLYTLGAGGEKLSINTNYSTDETPSIPLSMLPGVAGTYRLKIEGVNSFDATSYIYLEDKTTGQWTDLRQNPSYAFAMAPGESIDRFVLHFTPAVDIATLDALCSAPGEINITQPGTATWRYKLTSAATQTLVASGALNQSMPVHASVEPGLYTLALADNSNYTVVRHIQVGGAQSVTGGFTASTQAPQAMQDIAFNSDAANAVQYEWEFSDGTAITGVANPVYAFIEPGTYTVTLTVVTEDGCISSSTQTITVAGQSATGLSSINNNNGIKVWSNRNKVSVDFTRVRNVNATIEIYNVLGQEICNDKFNSTAIYSKELNQFETAYVLVKIINGGDVITKKLLIEQ